MPACITPLSVMHKLKGSIPVPCGKCPICINKRISSWSFRLMQEYKVSTSGYFITMTYDTEYIPISENGFLELSRRDLQLFFKRLRKLHEKGNVCKGKSIKYYAVGEYGGKTQRPHYHIILFNAQLELIQPAWNQGSVHYGYVSEASVGYTMKYISKPSKVPMFKDDDRTKEFSLMSKGLGESYLTKSMVRWHRKDIDNRMYCNIDGGKKISMPRYYKDKVYNDYERKRIGYLALLQSELENEKLIDQLGYDQAVLRKISLDLGRFKKHKFQNRVETRKKV